MPRREDVPGRGPMNKDRCTACNKRKLKETRRIERQGMCRVWSICSGCDASQLLIKSSRHEEALIRNRPKVPGKGRRQKSSWEKAVITDQSLQLIE